MNKSFRTSTADGAVVEFGLVRHALLAKLDDGVNIRFLDIGGVFLGRDGKIPWTLMPDQLHPTAAGYQLWAEAMQPLLLSMIK